MRKLRKILAATLAGAMLSGMIVAPAYADDPSEPAAEETTTTAESTTEDYKTAPAGYIKVTKKLYVQEGSVIPDGTTFTFKMVPVDPSESEYVDSTRGTGANEFPVVKGKDLTTSTVTVTFNSESEKVDVAGSSTMEVATAVAYFKYEGVDFSTLADGTTKITGPTYFAYRVYEEQNTTYSDYITYGYQGSKTSYEDVEIFVDNSGAVQSVIAYGTGDEDDTKLPLLFENRCITTGIQITKTLAGSAVATSDSNVEWNFTLEIPVAGDAYEEETGISGKLTLGENAEFTVYKTDQDGVRAESESIKVGTPLEFTLKDGESLEIPGVPIGMVYRVEEATNTLGYTASISAIDMVNGIAVSTEPANLGNIRTYTGKTQYLTTGVNTVAYTNTKNVVSDEGVRVDVMPYAVVCLLVLAGAVVLLFVRKRRTLK